MILQLPPTQLRRRQWPLAIWLATALLLGGLLSAATPAVSLPPAAAAPRSIDLGLERFATGFAQPTDIGAVPDGRLFVAEQRGVVHLLAADGTVLAPPLLDIRAKVNFDGDVHGLLGVVFEPADATTFYVHYTNAALLSVIARYHTLSGDPNQADPASEEVLLTIDYEGGQHNGGDLTFGPDGHLYIPYGTGPGGGGSNTNAQNLAKLLGKVLRIHVTGETTYTIPAGNPFAEDGDDATLPEIWSYGWRNPWRLSFDRATGEMFVGDVGQNEWEEISFEPPNTPGRNYGWQFCEGFYRYPPESRKACPNDIYVAPIFAYAHGGLCAVTGGYVYRGARYPNLAGHYVLGDYCTGNFWTLVADGQGGWDATDHGRQAAKAPSTFGEDSAGELYVADYNSGAIYRVVDRSPQPATPTPSPTATATQQPTATLITPWATLDRKGYLPFIQGGSSPP